MSTTASRVEAEQGWDPGSDLAGARDLSATSHEWRVTVL